MIVKKEYPILEYDDAPNAKIMPGNFMKKTLPSRCVITFFREAFEQHALDEHWKLLDYLNSEIINLPIYEAERNGEKLCVAIPFMTAPGAACSLEELHAMGCEKFVICGGAGSLCPDLSVGHLIVPNAAVRDEGTSYHYLPPSREVECPKDAFDDICSYLKSHHLPFVSGKTWTTDAIYRETEDKIQLRTKEGCITVEMEAAAFFAVSKYLGVKLGQILYSGDDLTGEQWDNRDWNKQKSVRDNLLEISLDLCSMF